MREIKFRAWDIDEKIMIDCFRDYAISFDGIVYKIDSDYKLENTAFRNMAIMQFTGLLDKNGKDIYEGDIVKGQFGKYLIEWYEDGAQFRVKKLKAGQCRCFVRGMGEDLEVIGNIYEHAHLLENKNA